MRTLFEHLLPMLAPDDAIREWKPESLPREGPVPYKVRLPFIFRRTAQRERYDRMAINDAQYVERTLDDIEHVLQSLLLLSEEVHRLVPGVSDVTLRWIVVRWEFSLQQVLMAHDEGEGST